MPMKFNNPLVALVYAPGVDVDRMIHTACYSGMLSNVHECAADRLFSRKSLLIMLKPEETREPAQLIPGYEPPAGTEF